MTCKCGFVGPYQASTLFVLSQMTCDLHVCVQSYAGSVRVSSTREIQSWVDVPIGGEPEDVVVRVGYQGVRTERDPMMGSASIRASSTQHNPSHPSTSIPRSEKSDQILAANLSGKTD
jgi:hypothetical protein